LDSLDGGSASRKAPTYTEQHNTEKRGHRSMPRAGFESTIPLQKGCFLNIINYIYT